MSGDILTSYRKLNTRVKTEQIYSLDSVDLAYKKNKINKYYGFTFLKF